MLVLFYRPAEDVRHAIVFVFEHKWYGNSWISTICSDFAPRGGNSRRKAVLNGLGTATQAKDI